MIRRGFISTQKKLVVPVYYSIEIGTWKKKRKEKSRTQKYANVKINLFYQLTALSRYSDIF